jgi:hypothetical protein
MKDLSATVTTCDNLGELFLSKDEMLNYRE